MVKIIVNWWQIRNYTSDWMGSTQYHIPAYKRHVPAQITLILMDLMIDLIVD